MTGPTRRLDTTGRAQYTRKSTQAEIARRDGWIVKLYQRGHTTMEIAAALNIGRNTIGERLSVLGLFKAKRVKGRGPVTFPCPWRDEDIPVEQQDYYVPPQARESRWRQSRIVNMAQMLNDEYRESNFSNILANQATDAEEGGDKDWLMEALATFNAAIEKLDRARRVLTDDDYRVACRDTLEGVEQMRRKQSSLRAVR